MKESPIYIYMYMYIYIYGSNGIIIPFIYWITNPELIMNQHGVDHSRSQIPLNRLPSLIDQSNQHHEKSNVINVKKSSIPFINLLVIQVLSDVQVQL